MTFFLCSHSRDSTSYCYTGMSIMGFHWKLTKSHRWDACIPCQPPSYKKSGSGSRKPCSKARTSAKMIYGLACLLGLYGLPWLTPGFLDICKYDFWLTLLTRLISYFPLRSSLLNTWFRALSHLARYACYFRHPNSTNLVTLVHLRLSSTGTHKLICMSGIRFPCVIETRPGGALRKPVSLLKVVC